MLDCHLHVVPPRLPGVGCLDPICEQPPEVVAARLRDELRAAGLTHALAMGQWDAGDDDPLGVRTTLAVAERVPGLRPIGVCCPKRGGDPDHLRRVEQELARGRVAALKCYLGYLHYEPAHPHYRRYYELAAQFKLPVVFHTGDTFSAMAKLRFAHPLGVDEVAVDHRDTKFVLAHCGNPWLTDAAEVVYKNLNVWADLSGLVVGDAGTFADPDRKDQLADIAAGLRRAFRYAERPNRFVFGTDWPLVPIQPYRQFLAGVLPAVHHELIFTATGRQLFRL
jgi:hypothetical protein